MLQGQVVTVAFSQKLEDNKSFELYIVWNIFQTSSAPLHAELGEKDGKTKNVCPKTKHTCYILENLTLRQNNQL